MAFLAPTMSKVLNLPQYNRVLRWIFKIGGNYMNLNNFRGKSLMKLVEFTINLEKIGGDLGALQYNVPLAGYEHVLCIKL